MSNKNKKNNRIKPQILKGFRDILPEEINAREKIIGIIREVFENYGFSPMASPALEYKEVLCGYGDEASKQIYTFTDPDDKEVGLRFDLTLPLSRIVSQYRDLPRPFKRYQIQPVWRYDKPDPGRFREFLQFDIDTIGTKSLVADSEILAAMNDSLTKRGDRFKIRYSSRKILTSMIKFAGVDESLTKDVLRVIDKLDKQGIANVKLELAEGRIDNSGDKIKGVGLNPAQIEKIEQYLKLPNIERKETLKALRVLLSGVEGVKENISELEEIDGFLRAMNVPDENIVIDPSIARGLDYYTGPIYEAIMLDAPRFGSVMGGGRYDNLIEVFAGQPTPAVGASIGVDRIISAMQSLGKVKTRAAVADVLVTVMDKERMPEYLQIAGELRDAGIKAEVFLGKAGNIGKQLKYADRQGHPFALILGQDEFDAGTVSLKDLRKIEDMDEEIVDRDAWLKARIGQQTLKREELIFALKSLIK
ncbi:MAG: histidine--tRNA ligase [Planctomycetes bacterium]|nr:histidine--tRNA ligase [Planctomycetota bacterium]